jgi:peptidoglycan/LPS O-acetylase OafA/YrhL
MNHGVEYLRVLAVTLVLIYHSVGSLYAYGVGDMLHKQFTSLMYSGVDLFFVISGYVIGSSYLKSMNFNSTSFLTMRLIRILPSYYLLSSILLFIQFTDPLGSVNSEVDLEKFFLSLGMLSWLFWEKSPYLYVGWSLEYEMGFYLLFVLSIVFFNNIKARLFFLCSLILLLVILFRLDWLFFEFFVGLILSWFIQINLKKSLKNLVALVLIFIGFALITNFSEFERSIKFGFFYGGLVLLIANFKFVGNSYILSVASATYSVYLIQVFTIPFLVKVFVSLNVDAAVILTICIVLTTVVCGLIWHTYIDLPLRNKLKKVLL